MKEKSEKPYPKQHKEPIEMDSDELLEYVLDPELADAVKQQAKPDEGTDSERECQRLPCAALSSKSLPALSR